MLKTLFFILVISSFLLEECVKPCHPKEKGLKQKLVSFIHHLITIYIFLGSFVFGKHILHLVIFSLVWLHWKLMKFYTGKEYCIITRYYNNLCGHNIEDQHYNIPNVLGVYNIIYFIVFYDIYHVIKN